MVFSGLFWSLAKLLYTLPDKVLLPIIKRQFWKGTRTQRARTDTLTVKEKLAHATLTHPHTFKHYMCVCLCLCVCIENWNINKHLMKNTLLIQPAGSYSNQVEQGVRQATNRPRFAEVRMEPFTTVFYWEFFRTTKVRLTRLTRRNSIRYWWLLRYEVCACVRVCLRVCLRVCMFVCLCVCACK